jgi:hypothetical protein
MRGPLYRLSCANQQEWANFSSCNTRRDTAGEKSIETGSSMASQNDQINIQTLSQTK